MAKEDKNIHPNIVVFDLETGGFSPEKHPIIEIAVLSLDCELEEVERKEWIILPYDNEKEYTAGAFKANGFTMGEINKRGIEADIVVRELKEFFERQKMQPKFEISYVPDSKPVLAGHNIDKFDIPFLIQFFKDHGLDLHKYVSKKDTQDTLIWAKRIFGYSDYQFKNYQLGTCCQYIGFPIVDAHKAMNDVEGNTKLLKYFIEGARGISNGVVQDTEERERDSFKLS